MTAQTKTAHTNEPADNAPVFTVSGERVRWEDVDLAGIMRYSAYPRLFDTAESELLRACGITVSEAAERLGVWLPRRVMRVEYLAPARYDDPLSVDTRIVALGTTSITLSFAVRGSENGVRHVEGTLVLVCVGRDDLAKRQLPAELIERLGPYLPSR